MSNGVKGNPYAQSMHFGAGRRHSYSPLERGLSSVVWRPDRIGEDKFRIANMAGWKRVQGFDRALELAPQEHPVVLREVCWAHQQEGGGDFKYFQPPGQAEEDGGVASGGKFYCLPGQTVNETRVIDVALQAYITYAPGVYTSWGWPAVEDGDLMPESWRVGKVRNEGIILWQERVGP